MRPLHVATSAWGLFIALVLAALALDLGFDARERRLALSIPLGAVSLRSPLAARCRATALCRKAGAHGRRRVCRVRIVGCPLHPRYAGDARGQVLDTSEWPPRRDAALIALIIIELSDMVFSLDSIPAVLGITREPFLVYTSNVFAMLGLRSLYFLLIGAVARFHALRYALAAILVFVSAKMLLSRVVDVPSWVSLAVILLILAITALASLGRRNGARIV